MKPQLTMLLNMHKVLIVNQELSPDESFGHLLDFVASRLTFQDTIPTPWMKLSTIEMLDSYLDIDVLREDPWDWFGEVHQHEKLNCIPGEFYMDYDEAHKEADITLMQTQEGKPLRILDECAATGRGILALFKLYPNAIFYGAENDLFTYRILMLNMKIYNVQHIIVNANHVSNDLRGHSPNWRFANMWSPVKQEKYFTEEETDERVTITEQGIYKLV